MSTVQVTLVWASWAVPSRPARLAAAELARAVPCSVTEVDFSLGMLSPDLEAWPGADADGGPSHASLLRGLLEVHGFALPLPTWIISVPGSDDHRVIHGAVPKFQVREAIDDLLAGGV